MSRKLPIAVKSCDYCGKMFRIKRTHRGQKFCTKRCSMDNGGGLIAGRESLMELRLGVQ